MPANTSDRLLEENERLQRAVDELSILNELAVEIGSESDLDRVISRIARKARRAIGAAEGVVTILDEPDTEAGKTLFRTRSSGPGEPLHLQTSLMGWMQLHRRPLIILDPETDARFQGTQFDPSVRTVLSVPLLSRGKLVGILTLFNKHDPSGFTDEDARLLSIMATQSAQVLLNAKLARDENELRRVQSELQVAREIQENLLPKAAPPLDAYSLAGLSIPAAGVGGDYFDFIPLAEHQMAVCVGDVSGKGMPAALLMANVQATLRSQVRLGVAPAQVVARTNSLLHSRIRPGSFVTLCYAEVNRTDHSIVLVNAGHNPPLVRRAGGNVEALATGDLVLGVLAEFPYRQEVVHLGPGDALLLYSDGITEARSPNDVEYGDERLVELFGRLTAKDAGALIEEIRTDVQRFGRSGAYRDDLTLLAVIRRADPS